MNEIERFQADSSKAVATFKAANLAHTDDVNEVAARSWVKALVAALAETVT